MTAEPKSKTMGAHMESKAAEKPEVALASMISDVWLAYASACFYKRSTRGRTDPVFFMGNGFRENHLKVKSEWKLTTGGPPLLEHMCDFSDGYLYNEQNGILLKEKLPSPFDKESTNVRPRRGGGE